MGKLYNDDCMNILKNIQSDSIDLIVTDCPYHIVSGGCSTGEYSNKKHKTPTGIFERKRTGYRQNGEYFLEGTKHISLGGVLDDNNSTTYARQGKLFKFNDIKFSDWLPELYRVLKSGKHIYIYIY